MIPPAGLRLRSPVGYAQAPATGPWAGCAGQFDASNTSAGRPPPSAGASLLAGHGFLSPRTLGGSSSVSDIAGQALPAPLQHSGSLGSLRGSLLGAPVVSSARSSGSLLGAPVVYRSASVGSSASQGLQSPRVVRVITLPAGAAAASPRNCLVVPRVDLRRVRTPSLPPSPQRQASPGRPASPRRQASEPPHLSEPLGSDYGTMTSPRESLPSNQQSSRWSRAATPRSYAPRDACGCDPNDVLASGKATPTGEGGFDNAEYRAFVPYARRAGDSPRRRHRSGNLLGLSRASVASRSSSPRGSVWRETGEWCESLRPAAPTRRLEALYGDYELRRQRHEARVEAKRVREEEEIREQLKATSTRRAFNKDSFQDWYKDRMGRHQSLEQARKELQRNFAELKEVEELVDCTFRPLSPRSARGVRPSSPGRTLGHAGAVKDTLKGKVSAPAKQGQRDPQREQVLADELIAAQITAIEILRTLDLKEKDRVAALQREHARGLGNDLQETKHRLERFVESAEGRKYLLGRAKTYTDLNPGMSEAAGAAEAARDLVRASEEKLRSEADAALRERLEPLRHQLRYERMKVVYELVQLKRKCQELVSHKAIPKSLLHGFDHGILDRLTQEPWYVEAREATRGLRLADDA